MISTRNLLFGFIVLSFSFTVMSCGGGGGSGGGCQSGYRDCGNFCCPTADNCCWTARLCCVSTHPWYCAATNLCYAGALPPSNCGNAELCGIIAGQNLLPADAVPGLVPAIDINGEGVPPMQAMLK